MAAPVDVLHYTQNYWNENGNDKYGRDKYYLPNKKYFLCLQFFTFLESIWVNYLSKRSVV